MSECYLPRIVNTYYKLTPINHANIIYNLIILLQVSSMVIARSNQQEMSLYFELEYHDANHSTVINDKETTVRSDACVSEVLLIWDIKQE